MGNPDLVIIVNGQAFLIKGTDYTLRSYALNMAMQQFEELQLEIDRGRRNKNGSLAKGADPNWMQEDINSVAVYNIARVQE